ncbi:unnamed protein product [Medioppia subpectinata]|uniref:Uncharacterized protein n=1 Tax=Medioppia subpectinata TaxID=1979941 RepID=A0A7R9PVF6_9ACAR|nr:unnamed protein product [Medioppia subpectinata]CAG2102779.1 unnamed protein product [Medioppia subpectinata]
MTNTLYLLPMHLPTSPSLIHFSPNVTQHEEREEEKEHSIGYEWKQENSYMTCISSRLHYTFSFARQCVHHISRCCELTPKKVVSMRFSQCLSPYMPKAIPRVESNNFFLLLLYRRLDILKRAGSDGLTATTLVSDGVRREVEVISKK